MNKIVKVMLNRAEGPSALCGKKEFDEQAIRNGEVLKTLQTWGMTAPKNGGYDKVDFEVEWEGGHSYCGRFDMKFGGTDGHANFWASLFNRLEFYSCRRRPSHFKDNHWSHFVKQAEDSGSKAVCEAILNECEVPQFS